MPGHDAAARMGPDFGTYHHRSVLGGEGGELHGLRRAAVELRGLLDHVDIFLVAHTGYGAVVLHAYEQTSAAVVGEGRNGARYLDRIGYQVFEILPFMFAFGHHPPQIEGSSPGLYVFHSG